MTTINKNDLEILAKEVFPHCISILIPTHKGGREMNKLEDRLLFKNKLNEAKLKLKEFELTDDEVADYLGHAEKLVDDTGFWHKMSHGLAVFIHKNRFEYYSLPIAFDEMIYVSNHFYTSPVLPYLFENSEYYLLALSENEVKLYNCSRFSINEVDTRNIIPHQLEEVVGFDYQEKYSTFRTQQSGGNKNGNRDQRHGQGEGKDDVKIEYERFFTEVNNGIVKYLQDKKTPLLVASVEFLHGIYKKTNRYKYLYPGYVPGNHDYVNTTVLHQKANEVMADYFHKRMKDKKIVFDESVRKTSTSLADIVSGSVNGKVDTLFVSKGKQVFGQYDKSSERVYVHEAKHVNNTCLVNLSATEAFLQGAEVYVIPQEEMPVKEAIMNGIFRF